MKKEDMKKILIPTVIFVLSIFIVIGEGFYRTTLTKESVSLGVTIPSENAKSIVYDIAKQSTPKRLVQPGKISLATGHGSPGIVNKGKEPIAIAVKAEGFSGNVQITSKDPSFVTETGKFTKPIQPGKDLNLSIILDISRKELKNNSVSNGNIQFTDYNTGKLLTTLPVKVINSNVGASR